MSQFTAEQLSKLPKWSRDKITTLERELEVRRAALGRINAVSKSTVYQETGFGSDEMVQYLDDDYDVTFDFGEHRKITVRKARGADLAYYGPHVSVRDEGGHGLSIIPEVSNVIRVFSRK